LDSPEPHKGKGKTSHGKREKGEGRDRKLSRNSTLQPDRAHARTHERTKRNETISRLVSLPPTSDNIIYIYNTHAHHIFSIHDNILKNDQNNILEYSIYIHIYISDLSEHRGPQFG